MANWKVLRSETDSENNTVELRYAEFGKGKARAQYWRIFRNGEYAGYGATGDDAEANFGRVMSGYVRNPETGNYERAND